MLLLSTKCRKAGNQSVAFCIGATRVQAWDHEIPEKVGDVHTCCPYKKAWAATATRGLTFLRPQRLTTRVRRDVKFTLPTPITLPKLEGKARSHQSQTAKVATAKKESQRATHPTTTAKPLKKQLHETNTQ